MGGGLNSLFKNHDITGGFNAAESGRPSLAEIREVLGLPQETGGVSVEELKGELERTSRLQEGLNSLMNRVTIGLARLLMPVPADFTGRREDAPLGIVWENVGGVYREIVSRIPGIHIFSYVPEMRATVHFPRIWGRIVQAVQPLDDAEMDRLVSRYTGWLDSLGTFRGNLETLFIHYKGRHNKGRYNGDSKEDENGEKEGDGRVTIEREINRNIEKVMSDAVRFIGDMKYLISLSNMFLRYVKHLRNVVNDREGDGSTQNDIDYKDENFGDSFLERVANDRRERLRWREMFDILFPCLEGESRFVPHARFEELSRLFDLTVDSFVIFVMSLTRLRRLLTIKEEALRDIIAGLEEGDAS